MTALLRLSFVVLLVNAPAVSVAQPAPLPAEPQSLVAQIATTAEVVAGLRNQNFIADTCTVDRGELSCSCLLSDGVRYQKWQDGHVEGVVYTLGSAVLEASSATLVDDTWVLRDVWYVDHGSPLHAEQAHIDSSGATLSRVTWHESKRRPSLECGAAYRVDRPVARAASLTWSERGWRTTDYKAGPWPAPFASSAHHSAPGLLPPLVRTTKEAGSIEAAAALWGGSFATLSAGRNAPLTAGLGLTTLRQGRARTLRALAAYDDGKLEPVVYGDLAIGRRQHLRAHVEHPQTSATWLLRRFEAGGLLRDWRRSDIGLSGSAGAHSLQLVGSVSTDPRQQDDAWDGRLGYGTAFRQGRYTHWTLDLEHHSDRRDSTRHSTTAVLGMKVPLGSRRGAWIAPGLDLVANYGAVPAARGLDASTTLLALGAVEAGLAFEGRFGNTRHVVSPQARFGGELGGIQQRQVREGAPEYSFARPTGWRWLALALDQSVHQGDFTLSFPVGIFVDVMEGESVATGMRDLAGFVRFAAALTGASFDVAAACEAQCSDVSVLISGRIQPSSSVHASYIVSDLSPRTAALLEADHLLSRGHTALRLAEVGEAGALAHYATIGADVGAVHGQVFGAYGSEAASRGFGAELGWRYKSAGWGLSAGSGYAIATSNWVAMVGLSMHR